MHDANRLLSDLRDHLSRHDKRVGFLFGAGTSCAVRVPSCDGSGDTLPLIPDVSSLTGSCEEAVKNAGEEYCRAWDSIWLSCKETKRDPNIEDMLSRLRMMLEAVGSAETLAGLSRNELANLEEIMRRKIATAVNPDTTVVLETLPHRRFARWLTRVTRQHPVEIFTVNYDILFELGLETERVPIFDGFVGSYQPFFQPESLRLKEWAPGENYTRLWKMHGSVTWRKEPVAGRIRVIRGMPGETGEMILPSFQKYDESRQQPYIAFTDRFARFLEIDDALLVVCGFGFGDQHINSIIFEALDNQSRTHVCALQYSEPAQDSDLVKWSSQLPNILVVGPNQGIIGGRQDHWGVIDGHSAISEMYETIGTESDTENTSEAPETLMTPAKLKIGDFALFCDFLDSMTRN